MPGLLYQELGGVDVPSLPTVT
eukprot:UN15243